MHLTKSHVSIMYLKKKKKKRFVGDKKGVVKRKRGQGEYEGEEKREVYSASLICSFNHLQSDKSSS